jgi:hypothetical protein
MNNPHELVGKELFQICIEREKITLNFSENHSLKIDTKFQVTLPQQSTPQEWAPSKHFTCTNLFKLYLKKVTSISYLRNGGIKVALSPYGTITVQK